MAKTAIWRDFVAAVVDAVRRPTPARDAELRAEQCRGVRRLATEVVARNRRRSGRDRQAA
jgi:hypothetical protein